MDSATKQAIKRAFDTPPELCTPEQMALREMQLPTLPPGDARAEYEQMLVDRYKAGQPMSLDGQRRARKLIREQAT